MRRIVACLLALFSLGCGSTWEGLDSDGDGFTLAQGDCDDGPTGSGVSPGAKEVWYDGVDQNCDGNDGDQDGDGEPASEAGGLDCWDDPTFTPDEFVALNGLTQPEAADVLPGASEVWYDGVDQDCDGADDFDQDFDGFASTAWVETRTALPVEDCYDAVTEVYPEDWADCVVEANRVITAPLSPSAVNPVADDTWYDGTDANCDGADDWDKDGDTFAICAECDDSNATIFPNDAVEVWYNHVDENCDGNDADQDGDGYLEAGYAEADPLKPIHAEGAYGLDDCWDNPARIPAGYTSINGEPQPTAEEVHPDAEESWYDGVDGDCAADDDFDQDGDGDATEDEPNRAGLFGEDCDDNDGTINSGAAETWYDGVDQDCDGGSDYDQDHDGFDSADYTYGTKDDCDDEKSEVHPSKSWDPVNEDCATAYDDDCDGGTNDDDADSCIEFYDDSDLDGYGELANSRCLCIAESTYTETGVTAANDDCDDTRSAVSPAVANESCATTYDDDCDGVTNEQNGTSCTTYYLDADNDAYGTTTSQCWCSGSGSYDVTNSTDCDDTRSAVNPGVTIESCATTYDDDCDANTNEQNATSCTTYYYDDDGDAYGDASLSQCWCAGVGSYDVTNDDDCDDSDGDTFPGAAPNDSTSACMTDADADGYGSTTAPAGGTAGTDCDDSKSGVSPVDTETCGTTYDDDCDGSTNDTGATGCTTYYYDGDNDTYGKSSLSQCTCTTSGSYDVTTSTDCDDSDADTFPGAASLDSASACMNDDDADDYGDQTVSSGVTAGTDCDDTRATVSPVDVETCSTTYDDDCDSSSNDVGATGCTTYYYDSDLDLYGTTVSQCTCSTTGFYTATVSTDCDGSDGDTFPGAASLDSASACMNDDDGDNYGDETAPSGGTAGTDCNDLAATTYPGAADTLVTNDGVDNDCDDYIDESGVAFGDLVITEFFAGNVTATYDWFEIYNNSGYTVSLASWTAALCREGDTTVNSPPFVSGDCDAEVIVTFPSSATIADADYYVVCGSSGVFAVSSDCDLVITSYDSPAYTTSTDLEPAMGGVAIELGATVIDSVYWWQGSGSASADDWPADASTGIDGQLTSIQLDDATMFATSPDPADANDDYTTVTSAPYVDDIWCTAEDAGITNIWSASFFIVGTPGAANVACP